MLDQDISPPAHAPEPASETEPMVQDLELAAMGELRRLLRGDVRMLKPLLFKSLEVLNGRYRLRKCVRVGRYVRVTGRPLIYAHGDISVGDRVIIRNETVRCELVAENGGHLEIGPRTWVGYGSSIAAQCSIRIGADCHIGPYTNILDNDYHDVYDHRVRPESRPVTIGDGVWIGTRAIILPGVTIGEGAVIGAGSVVTRDVPPRTIAAGNPARVLRSL